MKGEQFAKIFETKNGQVLVTKDYDYSADVHQLEYQMDINGVFVKVQMGSQLDDDELAKKDIQTLFDNCDMETATSVSNMIIEQVLTTN